MNTASLVNDTVVFDRSRLAYTTCQDVALKRSYRNETTNQYELEVLNPKIREQMTFVMNQPLYEVEPNVFTRGIPINPSRLNRVQTDLSGAAHETPCHKALGGAYAISPDDDDELFERTELRTSRRASTKELGVYGDAQAICEGNLRSRLFYFGALYQAAVRMRLLRGVDMLEVRCGKFAVSGWRCADAAAGAEREVRQICNEWLHILPHAVVLVHSEWHEVDDRS
eukprot:gene7182-8563_t